MPFPVALNPASGELLRKALTAAAGEDGALGRVLGDNSVTTVVVAVGVAGDPAARLLQVVRAPDPLAQWADLSCI